MQKMEEIIDKKHPKCIYCGKPVEDIGELDIPYHIDCALEAIEKMKEK